MCISFPVLKKIGGKWFVRNCKVLYSKLFTYSDLRGVQPVGCYYRALKINNAQNNWPGKDCLLIDKLSKFCDSWYTRSTDLIIIYNRTLVYDLQLIIHLYFFERLLSTLFFKVLLYLSTLHIIRSRYFLIVRGKVIN